MPVHRTHFQTVNVEPLDGESSEDRWPGRWFSVTVSFTISSAATTVNWQWEISAQLCHVMVHRLGPPLWMILTCYQSSPTGKLVGYRPTDRLCSMRTMTARCLALCASTSYGSAHSVHLVRDFTASHLSAGDEMQFRTTIFERRAVPNRSLGRFLALDVDSGRCGFNWVVCRWPHCIHAR